MGDLVDAGVVGTTPVAHIERHVIAPDVTAEDGTNNADKVAKSRSSNRVLRWCSPVLCPTPAIRHVRSTYPPGPCTPPQSKPPSVGDLFPPTHRPASAAVNPRRLTETVRLRETVEIHSEIVCIACESWIPTSGGSIISPLLWSSPQHTNPMAQCVLSRSLVKHD